MNRELDHLVDECLTRMQIDGWSVKQCLEANPEQSDVLGPLLVLGLEIHSHLSPAPPDPHFVLNSKKRIQNRMRARVGNKSRRGSASAEYRRTWFLRPAYVLASLVLVIVLLASGIGVVSASAASLPGDALYGVKLAHERLALTLSLTAEGDQDLLAEFAETRLQEAVSLIEQNRLDDLPVAMQGFENALDELEDLADKNEDMQPGSLEHLKGRLENHIQVLERVMESAPEPARQALQKAIDRSSHSREVLESVRGEGHPSENAPGQNKQEDKDKDKEKDKENKPNSSELRGGPKQKDERENGPPPWANND